MDTHCEPSFINSVSGLVSKEAVRPIRNVGWLGFKSVSGLASKEAIRPIRDVLSLYRLWSFS